MSVSAFWTPVLLMALGFTGLLALVFIAAVISVWWEDRADRRYDPSPAEAAWEHHVATTPGIGNDSTGLTRWTTVTAAEMQPFEEALRQVPVIDFEEGA